MPFEIAFPFYSSKIQRHVNQIFVMGFHDYLINGIQRTILLWNTTLIPQRSYQLGIWNDFEMRKRFKRFSCNKILQILMLNWRSRTKMIFLWVRMRRYISFMPHYITCNIISIFSPLLVDVVINSCVFPTLISKTKLINRLVQG